MMKKLLFFLFFSVIGIALQSCSKIGGGKELVVSLHHVSDDDNSVPQNQFVLSTPIGDFLHPCNDSYTRVSNIYLRTLQQLFQQWNREVIKNHIRYTQQAQTILLLYSDVTHYIGHGVDVSLYVYRIRHILI